MFEMGMFLLSRHRRAEGLGWLRKAMKRGDGTAAYHLGLEAEVRSKGNALRLFLRGARLGDPDAATSAARLLEERGSVREVRQAARLYELAARKEGRDAEGDLARIDRRLSWIRAHAGKGPPRCPPAI